MGHFFFENDQAVVVTLSGHVEWIFVHKYWSYLHTVEALYYKFLQVDEGSKNKEDVAIEFDFRLQNPQLF